MTVVPSLFYEDLPSEYYKGSAGPTVHLQMCELQKAEVNQTAKL